MPRIVSGAAGLTIGTAQGADAGPLAAGLTRAREIREREQSARLDERQVAGQEQLQSARMQAYMAQRALAEQRLTQERAEQEMAMASQMAEQQAATDYFEAMAGEFGLAPEEAAIVGSLPEDLRELELVRLHEQRKAQRQEQEMSAWVEQTSDQLLSMAESGFIDEALAQTTLQMLAQPDADPDQLQEALAAVQKSVTDNTRRAQRGAAQDGALTDLKGRLSEDPTNEDLQKLAIDVQSGRKSPQDALFEARVRSGDGARALEEMGLSADEAIQMRSERQRSSFVDTMSQWHQGILGPYTPPASDPSAPAPQSMNFPAASSGNAEPSGGWDVSKIPGSSEKPPPGGRKEKLVALREELKKAAPGLKKAKSVEEAKAMVAQILGKYGFTEEEFVNLQRQESEAGGGTAGQLGRMLEVK